MEELLKIDDIKRLIFSFGTIEHRVFMKKITNKLLLINKTRDKNIQNLLDDYRGVYVHSQVHPYSIEMFIHNIFNKQKQEDFLKQLNTCYCCSKHRHNRHPNIKKKIKFPSETCKCYCRHLSRNLYRTLNYIENNHIYETSDIYYSTTEYTYLKDII